MRFLPILTQIFLWTAVFAAAGGGIGAYSRDDVIAYYLLTMLGRAFSSMPGLASGIAGRSARRDQEVPDPADRPAAATCCWRGSPTSWCTTPWRRAVRAGVLALRRLLPRLAGRRTFWARSSRRC